MGPMTTAKRVVVGVAVGLVAVEVVAIAVVAALDARLVDLGYSDQFDSLTEPTSWPLVVAVLAPAVVGAVVVSAHPRNPVGWLFIGLSLSMLAAGLLEEWFTHAAIVEPPDVGGARIAAVLADKSFFPWWPLLTSILLLTPTGTYISWRWQVVGRTSVGATLVAFTAAMISSQPLNAPYDQEGKVTTVTAVGDPAAGVAALAMLVVATCLIVAGASLVVRWRRSQGNARRQLLWLTLAVVPLPAVIPLHLVAVTTDNQVMTLVTLSLFLVLIPVAAGLSVLRYRLYDVERVVATTLTYALLSMLLTMVYGLVVWAGSHLRVFDAPSATATATVGALAAATLFAPMRQGLQRRVDRRFNRRAFDAASVVRAALRDPEAGVDLEAVLRQALADYTTTLAFPGPDGWVDPTGAAAPTPSQTPARTPSPASLRHHEVARHGRVIARIAFDSERTDEATVARVGALAAVELDNMRLRADLRRHLSELASSRARIVEAQRAERRRIERDLHDGAQQHLLALAFELRSAQMNGDPTRMRDALAAGATSAQTAVRQLRDLANGLHPEVLTDGGLPAVLDELARHSPVPIAVVADERRASPTAEFTAWLVVSEAIVNAQKHADANCIWVTVGVTSERVDLCVRDDGRGGADATSSGLRGLQDRVAAAGGEATITSGAEGTTIVAVIPCAS